ncbi:MAG: Holliday junction branch migration DNA helicase RuvB [Dehalococcoidia bacterium]|nr:Holliday junction branch migration DNA helicase RuvB [Dehalococcoidia bacterium]
MAVAKEREGTPRRPSPEGSGSARPQREGPLTTALTSDDAGVETTLRPRRLEQYFGQEIVKRNLDIAIRAAKAREEPLDHVLFHGPPGLGKTTLAMIVAAELGVSIRITSGPAIERSGDLASLLTSLQAGDVLFIDEIHRLPLAVEEVLYPAMEDFSVDIILGKGPKARDIRLRLNHFTLLGATTRFALVSQPLRDRFGSTYRLEFYDEDALSQILRRSAGVIGCTIEEAAVREVARRSRGTARVANRLLRRVRDYAEVEGDGVITLELARVALERLEIDELGLDAMDRELLRAIIERFNGGPVGLDTLAAAISEESDTIMDVYEPYLLKLGFMQRTPRGRVAGRLAYVHLGLEPPLLASAPVVGAQAALFDEGDVVTS